MSTATTTRSAVERRALGRLHDFLGAGQRAVIVAGLRGEERAAFAEIVRDLCARLDAAPTTYETDGQGYAATAFLHYFLGGCDWWIVELDRGADGDTPADFQRQAFGISSLGFEPEMGYISISELLAMGAELDLYYTPRTVRDILGGAE
jgi:hypothetical protein